MFALPFLRQSFGSRMGHSEQVLKSETLKGFNFLGLSFVL